MAYKILYEQGPAEAFCILNIILNIRSKENMRSVEGEFEHE